MSAYARWLFGIAAVFNIGLGALALFGRPFLISLFGLDPVTGSNILVFNLVGVFVALFGYGYLRVAIAPAAQRPFVTFGALGKLAAIACGLAGWAGGVVGWRFPAFLSADLLFVLLFLDYLRRTRTAGM